MQVNRWIILECGIITRTPEDLSYAFRRKLGGRGIISLSV